VDLAGLLRGCNLCPNAVAVPPETKPKVPVLPPTHKRFATDCALLKSIEWIANRDLPPNTFPDP